MKRPSSDAAATSGTNRGHLIGLSVVGVIVVFVATWLHVHGREALAAAVRAPAPIVAIPDARFDPQAWHLPNDPMAGFVEIPAGVFTMGSDPAADPAAYSNERWSQTENQGRVELPAFYIARYEVTVAQFADFVAATKRTVSPQTLLAPAHHPVTNITWPDALAYAQWLEAQLLQAQAPAAIVALLKDGWHLSLPSEAQWEKAARGTDGRVYPWGQTPDPVKANFARSGTAPVGTFECAECASGLADMSGNVWELTRSPFQPYPYQLGDEARDSHADALFVMRGGAFNDAPNDVRVATRGGIDPGARTPFIGFRLVLDRT